jgi:hypothetical protein
VAVTSEDRIRPSITPLNCGFDEWSRLVSNQRPSACEADALPLSYETWETHRSVIDGTSEIITEVRVAENPDDRTASTLRR